MKVAELAYARVEYMGEAGKFAGKYDDLPICYSKTAVQMQVEHLNLHQE